ncbi:alpha/beta fold hydrolase [Gymnodinialimonas sp. 2305UL16-5]|uniref:alpha/beta hydrolase n=1 Tax=Gymnodinialimonas mytili TaxID=3126503 RepID=UPI0030982B04
MRLLSLIAALFPSVALADIVEIPGPNGPLAAEAITVSGATHAVVIIPGSGPTDRDGNAPQMGLNSDTYRLLAEGLAERGIASLRIDKRGFYDSETAIDDPNDVTIEAYAQDARDWVTRAAEIAPCVWLAGHSEGGLVALVAAQDPPDGLCGVILMAAPGRPVGQLMLEQLEANPANAPFLPELQTIISGLEGGDMRDPETISPILQPLFSDGLQRYMINLFSYDPADVARDWTGPALILQGNADIQIGPENGERLAAALPQAATVTLAEATHMLKRDVTGQPYATYTDPNLPLHEDAVPSIVAFIESSAPGE